MLIFEAEKFTGLSTQRTPNLAPMGMASFFWTCPSTVGALGKAKKRYTVQRETKLIQVRCLASKDGSRRSSNFRFRQLLWGCLPSC